MLLIFLILLILGLLFTTDNVWNFIGNHINLTHLQIVSIVCESYILYIYDLVT